MLQLAACAEHLRQKELQSDEHDWVFDFHNMTIWMAICTGGDLLCSCLILLPYVLTLVKQIHDQEVCSIPWHVLPDLKATTVSVHNAHLPQLSNMYSSIIFVTLHNIMGGGNCCVILHTDVPAAMQFRALAIRASVLVNAACI